MTIDIPESYQKRPIRFLELVSHEGWTVKVYGIAARGEYPREKLVAAGKRVAFERLPLPAVTSSRYGAAFLIVHQGADANWVLLDWWVDECILQHHVYSSPLARPEALEYVSPSGIMACVWELAVHGFERQAWIETILANPDGVDLAAYFARQLNADV